MVDDQNGNDGDAALGTAEAIQTALRKAMAEADQCFRANDDGRAAVAAVTKLHQIAGAWLGVMVQLGSQKKG